jgi:hypothetical protein
MKIVQSIRAWWTSLPHPVQAAIMLAGGAAAAAIQHGFLTAHGCLSAVCIRGYLWAGVHGGVAAVVALYIPSSLKLAPAPPPK